MFRLNLLPGDLEAAREAIKVSSIANHGKWDGSEEKQAIGLAAQVRVAQEFYPNTCLEDYLKPGFDGGFDIPICDHKIDVKTAIRDFCDPKPHYLAGVIDFQKDHPCTDYIFTSYNKKTSMLTVCGWITKKEFFATAIFYARGDKFHLDSGFSKEVPHDCWLAEYGDLKNLYSSRMMREVFEGVENKDEACDRQARLSDFV